MCSNGVDHRSFLIQVIRVQSYQTPRPIHFVYQPAVRQNHVRQEHLFPSSAMRHTTKTFRSIIKMSPSLHDIEKIQHLSGQPGITT